MSWDDIRIFVVVAEQKSLSKAAASLKVTPGMVSRRIDELEAALDVRLFTRTPNGVVLTTAGEDMLDRAISMQRFADAIEERVRGRDRRGEGLVTLRAPDGLTGYWIAPCVPHFQKENPKIQLTLDCGTLTDYVGADPDILITANKEDAQLGDFVEPLAVLHYVLVAAPKYIETYGKPKTIGAAAGEHRTLRHVGQTHQRESWDARAAAIEMLAKFDVISNSSHAIVQVALAGGGICTMPSAWCRLYPELEVIEPETAIPIQLWLVLRRDAQSLARVRQVSAWLKTIFDTKFNPWFREEYVRSDRFETEVNAASKRTSPDNQNARARGAVE
jgi:DNA-binding transcriptional LysR family regulator